MPKLIHKTRIAFDAQAAPALEGWRAQIPAGFCLQPLDAHFLFQHPEIGDEVLLFWENFERFNQNGLGYCLMDDSDRVASVCESVFVGCGEAEISISTAPEFRRRGLAYLTGAAYIEACLQQDLCPVWGCFPENAPSIALATSLGFTKSEQQPICFWEWKG